MKHYLMQILCCPKCKNELELSEVQESDGEIERGILICSHCSRNYPIIRFIPRFVPIENYAGNFGVQWNIFRKTQLDSYSHQTISQERFFRFSGWQAEELRDKLVLDVGCGAGRFAEIALSCGANLVALDYSLSVDACWQNLGPHPQLNIIQGDIFELPFKPGLFDFVYCFGVLQHTPDVKQAFLALPEYICSGGKLAVDVYPKLWLNFVWPKYWLRPWTVKMSSRSLFLFTLALVKILLPVSTFIGRIPFIGRKLRYAIPIANYEGVYPLSQEQLFEWSVLDTFDMYSPIHDYPQSAESLLAWSKQVGLNNVEVFRPGFIVCRGSK